MLCVIIPVFNHIEWTDKCLESITQGTVKPSEIILIDNGSIDPYKQLVEKYRSLNMLYIRNEENIGVNPAWNFALSITKRKNIMFLNNDTYINKFFIEKVLKVMSDPSIGICVPLREIAIHHLPLNNFHEDDPFFIDAPDIEGWAYTMKRIIYDMAGPIPTELKTYMGDSYFFFSSTWLGYKNVKMMNNTVYHYGSGTLKDFYTPVEMSAAHRIENHKWRTIRNSIMERVIRLKEEMNLEI